MNRTLTVMTAVLCLLVSCKSEQSSAIYTESEKKEISAELKSIPDTARLRWLADSLSETGDWDKASLVYNELGKKHRKNALFQDALDAHLKGLKAASVIQDTAEIVQAYNHMGTNYRRMGMLEEASNCHYRALELCDHFSDTLSYAAKKNKVVSLNGLGNINLTLGNSEAALAAFQRALAGECALGSDLGMAINYANIGSILEERGQIDSALVYYHLSMSHNVAIQSKLGISLCHNHFGRIAENRGDLKKAYQEYYGAYKVMEGSSDRWQWLESCTHLARVCMKLDKMEEARKILEKAEKTALAIESPEHLVQIYRLKSDFDEKRGQLASALENYKKSDQYAQILENEADRNQIQNARVSYVRNKGLREVELAKKAFENEQKSKRYVIYFTIIVLILSVFIIWMLLYVQKLRAKRNQALRKASEMQQSFFTNITHEFRTPLTVILGLAERYEKKASDRQEQKDMTTIVRQGNSLLTLVNQLLDVAKVRSAVGNPNWRTGDLVALAHMSVETIQPFASQKFIDIEVVSQETSIKMDFVPEYMVKIFHNLLSNAIKFTEKGGSVVVSLERDNRNVTMTVADTGRGIPPEDLVHIFDSFYQSSANGGQVDFQGSGIGLSMVQQMVKAMDGSIEAYSLVGKGTSFVIHLPQYRNVEVHKIWASDSLEAVNDESLKIACEQEEPKIESVAKEAPDKEIVLVVEDKQDLARYIGSILEKEYLVHYAVNGKEGLSKAGEYMPDIILTDVMMPEMDGFEFCDRVRNSEVLNHIPIIVITAKNTEEDKMKALEKGADAYLIKPFNAEELQIRIHKLLEQRSLLRQKFSKEMISDEGKMTSSDLLDQDKTFLLQLHKSIYAHISDSQFSSEKLADLMCMSRSQLNRKIKSITDLDSTSYIRQARIQYAYRLLITTDETIGSIMEMVGFEYRSYFNKIFKDQYGMTPVQFRNSRKKPDSAS